MPRPTPMCRRSGSQRRRRCGPWLLSMVLAVTFLIAQARADGPLSEEQLKAGFVFNFLKFVDWPEGIPQSEGLRLCILAQGSMGDSLRGLEGKEIRGVFLHVAEL